MSKAPVVSIIVPCYNQAQYLNETLDSVMSQTYHNWECIIINDGSTDNTAEISNLYCSKDPRFKYLLKQNGGVSVARNYGISQSTGTYLLPLDADDLIGPEYLYMALNVFDENSDTSLVYSKARLFGIVNEDWDLLPYSYVGLLKSNMIFCSSIFKRIDFDMAGGYDEQFKNGFEDWDLYIRLLNDRSKIHQLKDVHFYYRIKPISRSKSIDLKIQDELHMYLYNKYQHIYRAYFENPIEMLRKLDIYESVYKNSIDYKIGNQFLMPFRFIYKKIASKNTR